MTVAGNWRLTMDTPFGVQTPLLEINQDGNAYNGKLTGSAGSAPLEQLKVGGESFSFTAQIATPMGSFPVEFSATVEGDALTGTYTTMMGDTDFTGVRE